MSVVIIGGNECMVYQYESICRQYGYKAKIYTKASGAVRKKIGTPNYLILFTNTVSHKMVLGASEKAKKNHVPILRCGQSSVSALNNLMCSIAKGEK